MAFLMAMDSLSSWPPIPANSPLFCSLTVASLGASVGRKKNYEEGETRNENEKKKKVNKKDNNNNKDQKKYHTDSLSNSHRISSFFAGLSSQLSSHLFVHGASIFSQLVSLLGFGHILFFFFFFFFWLVQLLFEGREEKRKKEKRKKSQTILSAD